MRCCIASIGDYVLAKGPLEVGVVIGCHYHEDPDEPQARIADDGVWEWVGPSATGGPT